MGSRRRNGIRFTVLCALALAVVPPGRAAAQQIVPPFDGSYTVHDLGTPPGVLDRLGGLTLKAGTTDRLLISGDADEAAGGLYEIGVVRDARATSSASAGLRRVSPTPPTTTAASRTARVACSSSRAGR